MADETSFEIAAGALKGVGDATLGEWQERGEKAVHVRRRLSAKEQEVIGDMCDLRGTDQGRERLEKAFRWLPQFAWEYARQEAAGHRMSLHLGTTAGFAHKGGTFTTYLGELKRRGLVTESGGEIGATDAALDALGGKPPAPTSHEEAMKVWEKALKAGCFRMLQEVVAAGEHGVGRANLADRVDMAVSGGTFGTYLGILRRNGLVTERAGVIVATDVLWP